jgi:hypothetical protein
MFFIQQFRNELREEARYKAMLPYIYAIYIMGVVGIVAVLALVAMG